MTDDLTSLEQRVLDSAVLAVLVRLESAVTAHDHLLSELTDAVAGTVPPDTIEKLRKHLDEARKARTEAVTEVARLRELLATTAET